MAIEVLDRIKQGNLLFSIISLCTCTLILIIIIISKKLRSITYTFLMFIFCSEILNSIGNIIIDKTDNTKQGNDNNTQSQYDNEKGKNIAALCIISFTDVFTNLLFVFFSYCSFKLIKETNKLIKKKVSRFIIISAVISGIYMGIFLLLNLIRDNNFIDIRFRDFYSEDDKDKDKYNKDYFIISSVHTCIIIFLCILNFWNSCVFLSFMKEKQLNDKVNSRSIARLRTILRRYPIACASYWIFLIPRIIFVSLSGKQHILRDSIYFISESLFRLRGFLIFLNTFRSTKIQMIIYKIIEVNIKHNCLLNLKILYKTRKASVKVKKQITENLV